MHKEKQNLNLLIIMIINSLFNTNFVLQILMEILILININEMLHHFYFLKNMRFSKIHNFLFKNKIFYEQKYI